MYVPTKTLKSSEIRYFILFIIFLAMFQNAIVNITNIDVITNIIIINSCKDMEMKCKM